MTKAKTLTYLMLLFSVAVWGMSFVWTGQLLNFGFPAMSIVFLRLIAAAIFLLAISAILGKLQRPKRKHLSLFFLMALFEPLLYFLGETYGILKTSPTIASVIVSTVPLFTPILAYSFYRERISFGNFIGIVISILGVALVIFHKGIYTGLTIEGLLLLGLAVVSAIFYSAVVKRLADNYNPYTIVVFQNGIGALYFLPLFLIMDFQDFIAMKFTLHDFMPLIMLAVFASGIAFVFFVNAIAKLGMTRTNMFITLIPVMTAVFASLMGLEELTVLRFLGIVTVVLGLILSQRKSFSLKKVNKN